MPWEYAMFFTTPRTCIREVFSTRLAAFERLTELKAEHEPPYGGWIEKRKLIHELTDDAEPVGAIQVELT